MQSKKSLGWIVTMVLIVLLPLPVFAQEENEDETDDRRVFVLDPVKVTAQKKEQEAQEIPVSLSVVNELDLEDRNIGNLEDLVDYIPNMGISDTSILGENVITLRGITADPQTRTTATGLFIDGAPTIASFGLDSGFLNVERIEVLRGPQGTLYGQNTQAGVINVTTKKPGNEYQARVVGSGGIWAETEDGDGLLGSVGAAGSGPLVEDTLFLSLAARFDHQDGFIENSFTGEPEYEQQDYYGDAKLRLTPSPDWDISLSASGVLYRRDGNNSDISASTAAMLGNEGLADDRVVSSDADAGSSTDSDQQILNIAYDISDELKLTSISARKSTKLDGTIDFDFSDNIFNDQQGDNTSRNIILSQELRVNGDMDKFQWVAGFYTDYQDINYNVTFDFASGGMTLFSTETDAVTERRTYAAFGHASYEIFEDFTFLAGLRYEFQDVDFETNLVADDFEEDYSNLSPKVGVQYNFLPQVMGYATVSQGYLPGGFNDTTTNVDLLEYDSETLWAYEVGFKSQFLDKRLQINGAFFYMDINDKQVLENADLNNPTDTAITNAAEATSKGFELDFVGIPVEGLTLYGGVGYTDAEFDDFEDLQGDFSGNPLPYAPEYTFNVGGQYRSPGGFYLRTDVLGTGKTYFDKAKIGSRDAYTLVNAKIGYEGEDFDVYLFGNNIFNEEYNAENFFSGFITVYSDPGQYGLQFAYRF
jgi:iron complex outermembrane receptor protein